MQRTILLISSDQELINQITAHIETRGDFRIYAAATEDDALSTAAGRKVDAVLLDGDSLETHLPSFLNDLTDILPDARIYQFHVQNAFEDTEKKNTPASTLILHKPFSQREIDNALDEIPVPKIVPDAEDDSPFDEELLADDVDLEELSDYLGESELNNLNNLLENMPPPDPEEEAGTESAIQTSVEGIPPLQPSSSEDWIPMNLTANEPEADSGSDQVEPSHESLESESVNTPPPLPPLPVSEEIVEEQAEVSPRDSITGEQDTLTPVESLPGTAPLGVMSVRFDYYCVLIPNNPNQYLARDISDRLGFILPQLHIANGWRVTSLSIRPLFMMWQISLPADISPSDAVNEIRRRTTSHLYTNFNELLTNNDKSDFWAPGYLILSGPQAPSNSLIYDYIKNTRSAQQVQSE